MLPITITLTPTALNFNNLVDSGHIGIVDKLQLEYSDKNKCYILKGTPQELYKVLLDLTYTYDIELI